jgi:hypothetical protein
MVPLRSHVKFRSDAFAARPGEEGKINPGRWGAALVEYLKPQLADRGFTAKAVYTEDWGYVIDLDNPQFRLWIGCGNSEEYPDGFLCFVEPSKPPFVRRLFRKIETTDRVNAVANALEAALRAHPQVHSVRWWTEAEILRG